MSTTIIHCVILDGVGLVTDIILAESLMQEKKPARNMNGTVLQANPVKNIITNTISRQLQG